ncbi:MAG TPA: helix-hairpin-helix domain-containing protein [Kofleriaceae bacterium]|nr:helix-hairpin-helix domain-containing protein [Kofleriaceae bacterium]
MTSKAARSKVVADPDDGFSLSEETPATPIAVGVACAPSFLTGAELDDGWVLPPEWESALEPATLGLARGSGPVAVVAAPAPASAPATANRLDLNTATVETMCGLPGIGAKRAARIIALRDRLGGFASVDQLTGVQGIGAKTLEQLRTLLVVLPA